jgi:hypothetical protein
LDGLQEYFDDVVGKVLTAVEVDKLSSNQREINGVLELRRFFGDEDLRRFPLTWVDFDSEDQEPVPTQASWYDARAAHPTRTEWRLYLEPQLLATLVVGSLLVFARTGSTIYMLSSSSEAGKLQLSRVFSLDRDQLDFQKPDLESHAVLAAQQLILARLGIARSDAVDLGQLVISSFGKQYPVGVEFSEFARAHTYGVDPSADPDGALVAWMRTELEMFTALESHIEAEAMSLAPTLEDRLKIAMSVFQRRKSRAGKAFEYHLRALLDAHGLRYSHNPVTERKEEPDFVFPSISDYLDENFPAARLTMLGAKQTVRDRWRQVLSEADRIAPKHLATIDTQLSPSQIREMVASGVQPVVPIEIQVEYGADSRELMLSVDQFLKLVAEREGTGTVGG